MLEPEYSAVARLRESAVPVTVTAFAPPLQLMTAHVFM